MYKVGDWVNAYIYDGGKRGALGRVRIEEVKHLQRIFGDINPVIAYVVRTDDLSPSWWCSESSIVGISEPISKIASFFD